MYEYTHSLHPMHSRCLLSFYPSRLARNQGFQKNLWYEFLSRFNLTITYREGRESQVAHALSRFAYPDGESQNTNFSTKRMRNSVRL